MRVKSAAGVGRTAEVSVYFHEDEGSEYYAPISLPREFRGVNVRAYNLSIPEVQAVCGILLEASPKLVESLRGDAASAVNIKQSPPTSVVQENPRAGGIQAHNISQTITGFDVYVNKSGAKPARILIPEAAVKSRLL